MVPAQCKQLEAELKDAQTQLDGHKRETDVFNQSMKNQVCFGISLILKIS